MHLLLVTEALNYFYGVNENLLPAGRTGHVLYQVGLSKYTLQDSLNNGNRKHSPVLLQNVHIICLYNMYRTLNLTLGVPGVLPCNHCVCLSFVMLNEITPYLF